MANVGRISGPLLKANLVRNGINLAVEDDLLLIDVNNSRIGVNTLAPAYSLDVTGTTQTTALLAEQVTVDNVNIDGNNITAVTGNLLLSGNLATDGVELNDLILTQNKITTVNDGVNMLIDTGTNSSIVINGRLTITDAGNADTKLAYGSISINGQPAEALIESTTTDLDLQLSSNGIGKVVTNSNTQIGPTADPKDFRVTGNTILNGNLTVDGNITIGDANTDSITIGADFESNLNPNASATYDLGNASKTWQSAYIGNLQLTTNSLAATTTDSDIRVTPNGTGNVVADTTKSLVVPVGTSAQRPADVVGGIRWNTTNENLEAFDARTGINDWAVIPFGQQVRRYNFNATTGQTVFTGTDSNGETFSTVPGGTELVTQDGRLLEENTEYTTTATTLTLVTGAVAGEDINVVSIGTFKVADVVLKSTGGAFEGNIRLLQDLLVAGSTKLTDRIISIGTDSSGNAPANDDSQDRGINFRWHDGTSAKNGFFGYDDSTGYFTFVPEATIAGEVVSGGQGDIQASNFRGNLIASDVSTATLTATGLVTLTQQLTVTSGGTGLSSTTQGDILYSGTSNSLTPLGIGTTNTVLSSNGTSPVWSDSLSLGSTTNAASTTTGALITAGGVGIAQDMYVGGNTFITGNLTVDGDANINSPALTTTSNTIVLAEGSADATASNGAGVIIDLGSNGTAELLYANSTDRLVSNKNVQANTFIGALTGNALTASAWQSAITIALTGATTGSQTVDGSGNISIATTATSDPTLTLSGDATGTATFTNLGNATLSVTVTGGNAQTIDSLATSDFTLDRVTGNGATTTNDITANNITSNGTISGEVSGYISVVALQDVTALATDFADFQTRIAAL